LQVRIAGIRALDIIDYGPVSRPLAVWTLHCVSTAMLCKTGDGFMKTKLTLLTAMTMALSGPAWATDVETDVEIESDRTGSDVTIESESSAAEINGTADVTTRTKSRRAQGNSSQGSDDGFEEAFDDAGDAFDEIPEAFEDTF